MSRTRILSGAVAILDEGVYGDLTVDALARALRMSKSTLYKYFASKDDVVVALVDATCVETEGALADARLDAGSAVAALDRLVDVVANHAERIPRAVVLQQARLPGACQDRVALTRAALGQAMQRILDRGTRNGDFGVEDPVLAATAFMAASDAAMKAAARGEVTSSRGAAVRSVLDLFRPGLVRERLSA